MKTFKFKHPRRVYLYVLLSFLMCIAGAGNALSRTPRYPIVKIISGPIYSDNGTEVTLKLWMYNYDGDNAHYIGDVNLCIDEIAVCKLNNMWNLISNVDNEDRIKNFEKRGNVGSKGTLTLNGEEIGTAQFQNVLKNQKSPDNSNKTETKWTTIELKLSINNKLSYTKHTIRVRGKWRDWCDDKDISFINWETPNNLNGFVYPKYLDIDIHSHTDVTIEWEMSSQSTDELKKGKLMIYKYENNKYEKLASYSLANNPVSSISIPREQFNCFATYYATFQPNALSKKENIKGLTKSVVRNKHEFTSEEPVCYACKHYLLIYTTRNKKIVPLDPNMDFGAKMLSNTTYYANTDKFAIEFQKSITRIPDGAFKSTLINKNALYIPTTVTYIGAYAFADTPISGIINIQGATEIGEGAFMNCKNLVNVEFGSNLKKIGPYAFKRSNLERNLVIPNTVTEIGEKAFESCTNLPSVAFGSNLKEIGPHAFNNCTNLKGQLTFPENLIKIGKFAFSNCTGLSGDLVIPNSVIEIGDGAFYWCEGLNGKLSLPCNLSKIGDNVFSNCENLSGSLTIPETVKEIGLNAFYKCKGFTGDFVLPSALESIGKSAFAITQEKNKLIFQSLPKGMKEGYSYCNMKKCVNLSDASYVADDATADLDEASYSRTMSNTWGTLVLPFSLNLTGDEPYSLYAIDHITADELVLRRISERVEAGTAYVVRRDGEQQTLNFTVSNQCRLIKNMKPTKVAEGLNFQGTYHAKEVTDGYIIRNGLLWDVSKLKAASPQTEAIKVGPFRSWLDGTTNGAAKLSIRVDDSATGIDNPISSLNADDVEYYDLNGRRLTAPQQGINIMKRGNKTMKVIIK